MKNSAPALSLYSSALMYAEKPVIQAEICDQEAVDCRKFSETDLLRESAWVILCSGFRESVVRGVFKYISLCYCDWESSSSIVSAETSCRAAARSVFKNDAKLHAIGNTAALIHALGFDAFKKAVLCDPITELRKLPFIGPVTSWHLAKNLGFNVAKPDRHMARLAEMFGYRDAHHLCDDIACATGTKQSVVDLILWRYFADNPTLWGELKTYTPAA